MNIMQKNILTIAIFLPFAFANNFAMANDLNGCSQDEIILMLKGGFNKNDIAEMCKPGYMGTETRNNISYLSGEWKYLNGGGTGTITLEGDNVKMEFNWLDNEVLARPHYKFDGILVGNIIKGGKWKCTDGKQDKCKEWQDFEAVIEKGGNEIRFITITDKYGEGWKDIRIYR